MSEVYLFTTGVNQETVIQFFKESTNKDFKKRAEELQTGIDDRSKNPEIKSYAKAATITPADMTKMVEAQPQRNSVLLCLRAWIRLEKKPNNPEQHKPSQRWP
ncbi:hypothetical protein PR048_003480 [Dryococelus australis]|uniref:Uncharacterized protein n=1 Tax=Dryococelus australis TaxID=614101 RepID=A0ABQ9IPL6_9NEOP|nr:hypothetical protein PR048_003480 [Dryococelus australis]